MIEDLSKKLNESDSSEISFDKITFEQAKKIYRPRKQP